MVGPISRPWAGQSPASPGDAGSYTAIQWWNVWGPLVRASNALMLDSFDDIGVFLASDFKGTAWQAATAYAVGDIVIPTTTNFHAYQVSSISGTGTSAGAEPTWPTTPGTTVIDNAGANQITWTCLPPGGMYPYSTANNSTTIAPGSAIVDGAKFEDDTVTSFTIPSATAGNVRDDRIVLRKTFGAATQTVRLTLLTGGEVATPGPGTPPALTQSRTRATFWDIPIARVSVTDGGVITITDERVFVDAEEHKVLVPYQGGWGSAGHLEITSELVGFEQSATIETRVISFWRLPADLLQNTDITVTPVVCNWNTVAGNIVAQLDVARYNCGGSMTTSLHTSGQITHAVPGSVSRWDCLDDTVVIVPSINEYLHITFFRDGADGSDTAGVTYAPCVEISYMRWR